MLDLVRFATGRAKYLDRAPFERDATARILVRIALADLEGPRIAQLDTGAAWSILDPETAALLGVETVGQPFARLSTRLGVVHGYLTRVPTTLLAEQGSHLDFEGTFFVPRDWPTGRIFLGYSGLLDRVRFAIDPTTNDFYFGPSG